MKKLKSPIYGNAWSLVFSMLLAILMAITSLPHELLAQDLHGVGAPSLTSPADYDTLGNSGLGPVSPSAVISVETNTINDNVTQTTTLLQGTLINVSQAENIEVYFEYGLDAKYGLLSPSVNMDCSGKFSILVQGSIPAKTYHYRAFAKSSDNERYGQDRIFTTLAGVCGLPDAALSQNGADNATSSDASGSSDKGVMPSSDSPITTPVFDNQTQPLAGDYKSAQENKPRSTVKAQVNPDNDTQIQSRESKIRLKIPKGASNEILDVQLDEYVPEQRLSILRLFELNASKSQTKEKVSHFNKNLELQINYFPSLLSKLGFEN